MRAKVFDTPMNASHPINSTQVEDVGHVVEAGGFAGEEPGGAHRALGVGGAAGGAVGDLEALARAGEEDGVVAHHVAAPRHGEPDAAAPALAGAAVRRE